MCIVSEKGHELQILPNRVTHISSTDISFLQTTSTSGVSALSTFIVNLLSYSIYFLVIVL